ncbi:MOSC domain-containing protein [Histidinibacterium aquaticum]|uniref:MOSC domain-containing protein n=1 Tax=Histidinibacterium aquaticum TaxID=2613962 RepID=A0A5J5GP14_9RHOB|nr:MOSC domain-containing protein [Histidinibacterium aquaticum]KAA9009308.1 MOSC domain-containing protein [Histidinibacterium aquaticum]
MSDLARLRETFAGAGRLDWIGLRPERKAGLEAVRSGRVGPAGLEGDHARSGKRAVTLIQAEHLPVIAALAGLEAVEPETLRRNLVISGINLTALREHGLRIGEVVLRITAPCAPCSRMEVALGRGGYNAMRGHGGWCAEVVAPGEIVVGDVVTADLHP